MKGIEMDEKKWWARRSEVGKNEFCHLSCFLCFVLCVLCFVFCVLCFVFYVLCFVLCFVFCVRTSFEAEELKRTTECSPQR